MPQKTLDLARLDLGRSHPLPQKPMTELSGHPQLIDSVASAVTTIDEMLRQFVHERTERPFAVECDRSAP